MPFIFIDGSPIDGCDNVAAISFAEHQSGYLAGYAVVKEGYEKLGFSGGGGGTNPACCRFGYGADFSASTDLQTMINGWYNNDTEIVFACGGSMFQSIVAAAAANDGAVVGVDVDQSAQSDTVVTSAMKGLSASVQWAVAKVYDDSFSDIGGKGTSLGAKDDAVGLPTATWSLENYSVEEYEAQLADMASGKLVVDSMETEADFAKLTTTEWSNVKLNVIK